MSDKETLEKLLRDVDTFRFKSGFGLISFEESDAIRGLLEDNERLRALSVWGTTEPVGPLFDRLKSAEARIDAALALHMPNVIQGKHQRFEVCPVCSTRDGDAEDSPCPTVKALKGEK